MTCKWKAYIDALVNFMGAIKALVHIEKLRVNWTWIQQEVINMDDALGYTAQNADT